MELPSSGWTISLQPRQTCRHYRDWARRQIPTRQHGTGSKIRRVSTPLSSVIPGFRAFCSRPEPAGERTGGRPERQPAKVNPLGQPLRSERDRVVDALRRSGLDPGTGQADKRPSARHRLDRLIDLMNTRYLPGLQRIHLAKVDRKRSMLGGIPFTSERFPWPGPARAPYAPLVQLDLAEISASAGIDMGRDFLQLWCPIDKGMVGTRVASLPVRVIPRATVIRTKHLAPPPAMVIKCRNDPNYSWKQSLLGAPRYITGWREGGFALPDLTEFDVDSELRALSLRPQRPELGLAMFECPTLYKHFFELPLKWRPLVTIYGPVHGATFAGRSVMVHRAEIYFSHSRSGRVSFRAAWIRSDTYWSATEHSSRLALAESQKAQKSNDSICANEL